MQRHLCIMQVKAECTMHFYLGRKFKPGAACSL
jgi:hypothetical protein